MSLRPALTSVSEIRPRFAKSYTDGRVWRMPPRRAANDNQPATPVADPLAARRSLITTIPEWKGRPVKAWPTGTRLLRAKRADDLTALERWQDATAPLRLVAANDNTVQRDEDGAAIPPAVDRTMGIHPSELRLAANWSRASYTVRIDGTIERAPARRPAVVHLSKGAAFIRVGDLRFDGGVLSAYRSGDRWFPPKESQGVAKGGGSRKVDASVAIPRELPAGADAEDEAIRCIDGARLKARLTEEETAVLDWACSAATAAEIAIAVRGTASGKYAERLGVKLVDAAIARLRELQLDDVPSSDSGPHNR